MAPQTDNNPVSRVLVRLGIGHREIRDYAALLSGQVGRLVFSLIFFVTLARALSLGDFGLFATISSIGVVLSRISGFGFISPLYRVATTRPNLIGAYTSGYLVAVLASFPVVCLIAAAFYWTLYSSLVAFSTFALIAFTEILIWRSLEAVIIVNNGLNRFVIGSGLSIAGIAVKAGAALIFSLTGAGELENWALIYALSNAGLMIVAVILFYPKQRLRWKPRAWSGRLRDALGVSAAEALFYIQAELDKVLVLALGGEIIAGLYSILMRLIDLTAMPLRAFNVLLVQWIMRARQAGKATRLGLLADTGLFAVSIAGLLAIAGLTWIAPGVLGDNITMAAAYLVPALMVCAFRNAIEYHTELLYAHERMLARVFLLMALAVMKATLLAILLSQTADFAIIALWLNVLFASLYGLSAFVTYKRVLSTPHQLPQ